MRLFVALAHLLLLCLTAMADDVPALETSYDELKLNLQSIDCACQDMLPFKSHHFGPALNKMDSLELQEALDSQVTFVITVNPESRVKVQRGPYAIRLDRGWQNPILVKVINEGGITSQLQIKLRGPESITARFFEFQSSQNSSWKLNTKLSGREVEYQLLVLRSSQTGKHEVTFSFDAGQATQDLGFRAEVAALIHTTPGEKPFYDDHHRLLYYLDSNGNEIACNTTEQWQQFRRKDIIDRVESVMGKCPQIPASNVSSTLMHERQLTGVTLQKINFQTDHDAVPAYLLLPVSEKSKRLPAMLCLHQTTATGKDEPAGLAGNSNLHYAMELARRGYVTLAPDYPGYGDYKNAKPYALGYDSATMKGIVNHRYAVSLLASHPQVDPERIGCIGHSLGGHNTLFVGLFDERIKVMASSCGFCSFPKYYGGNLKGWSHQGYMPRIANVYASNPKHMPFDFTEMLGALAPRAVFINAPLHDSNFDIEGVRECVRAAKPVYDLYRHPTRLILESPESGHDFTADVRQRCYAFLDQQLKK